ncbi:MAG: hypothetical protein QM648_09855 [Solirubrobacterales bacterium]
MRLLALVFTTFALAVCASSAAAAQTADPNEKTTVTDIQWRISYSQEIPGNCAVFAFSQWTASKFKGWDVYKLGWTWTGTTTLATNSQISSAPKYDDELRYGGNTVSPPGGSHWVLLGDGSYRAGPPPAEAECQAMLAHSQTLFAGNQVTTFYRRTAACATKLAALTKAEKSYKKAKKKSKKVKSKAKKKLTKAQASFKKDCTK